MLWLSQVLDCSPDWDIGQNGERLWDLRVGIWRVVMRVPHMISGFLCLTVVSLSLAGTTVKGIQSGALTWSWLSPAHPPPLSSELH